MGGVDLAKEIILQSLRLGKSVVRIAAYWQYCWDMAGKPNLNEK